MNRIRVICPVFGILLLLFSTRVVAAQYRLFADGKSSYTIIVASNASESERYAAKELQTCLEKVSTVTLPIKNCGEGERGCRVILGYNDDVKRLLPHATKPKGNDESFFYRNICGDIIIVGGSERGTMYGVFSFLERELGVRWYTKTCSVYPSKTSYEFSRLDFSDAPGIPVRNIMYSEMRNASFRVHCRINEKIKTSPAKPNAQIGGCYSLLAPHTLGFLLPVDELFTSHQDYFALRNGKRKKGSTQPCFTNPEVLSVCVNNLRKVMRDYPQFDIYEVSTNDNHQHCECYKCKEAIERLGSYSDLVLDFVNRVADSVEKEFPNKKIEFLAYHEIRQPPVTVKPRNNVAVRVANIEVCHIHGFETCSSEQSQDFYMELLKWRGMTTELNVWEYGSNFSAYNIPYPNFVGLQENIRTYMRLGVKGILEEGNHYTYNGELQALRNYVLPRLLWNPDCDVDSLVNDFIYGYYGAASIYMRQYYDLIHSKVTENVHLTPSTPYDNNFYGGSFISDALAIFKNAKDAVKNDENVLRRVELEELSVGLLYSFRRPEQAVKDGTFGQVQKVMEREGIELRRKDLKQKYEEIEQLSKGIKPSLFLNFIEGVYNRFRALRN